LYDRRHACWRHALAWRHGGSSATRLQASNSMAQQWRGARSTICGAWLAEITYDAVARRTVANDLFHGASAAVTAHCLRRRACSYACHHSGAAGWRRPMRRNQRCVAGVAAAAAHAWLAKQRWRL